MNTMMTDLSQDFLRNGAVEVQGENGVFYPAYLHDIIEPSQLSQPQNCQLSTNTASNQQMNDQSICFGSMNGQQSGTVGAKSNTIISSSNTNETHVVVTFQNNFFPRSSFPISRIRLPPASSTSSLSSTSSATINNDMNNENDKNSNSLLSGLSGLNISNASNTNQLQSSNAANANNGTNTSMEGANHQNITVGMEVEVFSSSSEDQPRGWFRAVVKMIKGMDE